MSTTLLSLKSIMISLATSNSLRVGVGCGNGRPFLQPEQGAVQVCHGDVFGNDRRRAGISHRFDVAVEKSIGKANNGNTGKSSDEVPRQFYAVNGFHMNIGQYNIRRRSGSRLYSGIEIFSDGYNRKGIISFENRPENGSHEGMIIDHKNPQGINSTHQTK